MRHSSHPITRGDHSRYLAMVYSISDTIELPCGIRLPNRLVKSAMAECLAAHATGLPDELHYALYRTWAEAGYGLQITGKFCCFDLISR